MLAAIFFVGSIPLWIVLALIARTGGSHDFVTPMIYTAILIHWIAFWFISGFVIGLRG